MPFAATQMDLEIVILSKSERVRQISYDITYMWNLKYDTKFTKQNLFTKQKQTHRQRKQIYGYQRGRDKYIDINESLCCTPETNTTL